MKHKFENKDKDLYIDGKKVVEAWESFSGWYWFATEKDSTQDSYMGKNADGTDDIIKNDTIWFGLVQGMEEEWGSWSEGELNRLGSKVWKIPKSNWGWSGRRS